MPDSGGGAPCIVVADDNEDLRFLAMAALEDAAGATALCVDEAADGLAALDIIERRVREGARVLLLSDNRMPRMTGLELARRLRATHDSREVGIVLLSSARLPDALMREAAALDARAIERPNDLGGLRALLGGLVTEWVTTEPKPRA